MPSEALKFLVHTRALEVCLELNLKNGYSFHEKLTGHVVISENDQARYELCFSAGDDQGNIVFGMDFIVLSISTILTCLLSKS